MRTARIATTAVIPAPPGEVFGYVTTAANWPAWHPSSVAVRGAADHPGQVGDVIVEDFRVAGRTGTVEWTVTECRPPRRWVIEGVIVGRSSGGRITYELNPGNGGTRFERTFTYPIPWQFALVERLLVRRRVQAESAEATRRLAAVLGSHA
jgi:uncharacterized protein YndB with AHSA1/START domain